MSGSFALREIWVAPPITASFESGGRTRVTPVAVAETASWTPAVARGIGWAAVGGWAGVAGTRDGNPNVVFANGCCWLDE